MLTRVPHSLRHCMRRQRRLRCLRTERAAEAHRRMGGDRPRGGRRPASLDNSELGFRAQLASQLIGRGAPHLRALSRTAAACSCGAGRSAAMETPYIGASISLISKSEIRYEGILFTIDTKDSNIALQNGAQPALGAPATQRRSCRAWRAADLARRRALVACGHVG